MKLLKCEQEVVINFDADNDIASLGNNYSESSLYEIFKICPYNPWVYEKFLELEKCPYEIFKAAAFFEMEGLKSISKSSSNYADDAKKV